MSTLTDVRPAVQDLRESCERLCPWWADATPDEQALVLADMDYAVNVDGLSPEAYWENPMPKDEHLANVPDARADQVREKCVRSYGRGESALRDNLLRAGREANEYVRLRKAE